MSVHTFGLSPADHYRMTMTEWWTLYTWKLGKRHQLAKRGLAPGDAKRMAEELKEADGRTDS